VSAATLRRAVAARVLLAGLVAAALAVLLALGTWQLHRLEWKEALIAAARERPQAAPVAAPGPPAWTDFDIEAWRYRRVRITGRFGEREVYAFTVLSEPRGGPERGQGYFVVAPFTTTEGWSVLVNRGFVPQDRRAARTRPGSAPPSGVVTVEGLVRRDDPPNFVTPAPDAADGVWYTRDIASMAAHLGLPTAKVAPYSIDLVAGETPPGGLPQAGESLVAFRNSHLQYAITWYGLAAALVGVVAAALWRRWRAPATSGTIRST